MTDPTPPAVPEPVAPVAATTPAPVTPEPYAAPATSYAPAKPWNVLSIVSLVAAVLVGFGLVAVITGHIALSQIKKTGDQGRVLAIIGLVLGYLEILGGIIFTIFWIGIFIAAASSGYSY